MGGKRLGVPADIAEHQPAVAQRAHEVTLVAVGLFVDQISEKSNRLLVRDERVGVAAEMAKQIPGVS